MEARKVFGIGFHKTGTKSLAAGLRHLGLTVTGPFGVQDPLIAHHAADRGVAIAADFDAAQDNPWPMIYKELDSAYPDSRFILTVRDSDTWIESVVRHFGGASTPMREWIYGEGDPRGNEIRYQAVYEAHTRDVASYFADSPDRLLVMRIADGEGWEELCGFLGVDVPSQPFPKVNASRSRRLDRRIRYRLHRTLSRS